MQTQTSSCYSSPTSKTSIFIPTDDLATIRGNLIEEYKTPKNLHFQSLVGCLPLKRYPTSDTFRDSILDHFRLRAMITLHGETSHEKFENYNRTSIRISALSELFQFLDENRPYQNRNIALNKVPKTERKRNENSLIYSKLLLEQLDLLISPDPKIRPTEEKIRNALKKIESCNPKLVPEDVWKLLAEIALLEGPNSDVSFDSKDGSDYDPDEDFDDRYWEVWRTVFNAYIDYKGYLKKKLVEKLNFRYEDPNKRLITLLIDHPESFLASYYCNSINWDLIELLAAIYKGYYLNLREHKPRNISSTFSSAKPNILLQFCITYSALRDEKVSGKYYTIRSFRQRGSEDIGGLSANEVIKGRMLRLENPTYLQKKLSFLNNNEDYLKDLTEASKDNIFDITGFKEIFSEIIESIPTLIKEEGQNDSTNNFQIVKVDAVDIDICSEYLYPEIDEFLTNYAPKILGGIQRELENAEIKCKVNWSVFNENIKSEEIKVNEFLGITKQPISLFNYEFLQKVLADENPFHLLEIIKGDEEFFQNDIGKINPKNTNNSNFEATKTI